MDRKASEPKTATPVIFNADPGVRVLRAEGEADIKERKGEQGVGRNAGDALLRPERQHHVDRSRKRRPRAVKSMISVASCNDWIVRPRFAVGKSLRRSKVYMSKRRREQGRRVIVPTSFASWGGMPPEMAACPSKLLTPGANIARIELRFKA